MNKEIIKRIKKVLKKTRAFKVKLFLNQLLK